MGEDPLYAAAKEMRAMIDLQRRVYSPDTGSLLTPEGVADFIAELVPQTKAGAPEVAILDLRGQPPLTVGVLQELLLPLGQRLRGGAYGDLKVIIVASEAATRNYVELVAEAHHFPIFVADSVEEDEVEDAEPVGDLTEADLDTMNVLHEIGGSTTVSQFADWVGLEPSAANNRLTNVDRKGYVLRIRRGRKKGDLYIDPRARWQSVISADVDRPAMRQALRDAGIDTNPYERRDDEEAATAGRARRIVRGDRS
jgi:predicted transcriptional regulator